MSCLPCSCVGFVSYEKECVPFTLDAESVRLNQLNETTAVTIQLKLKNEWFSFVNNGPGITPHAWCSALGLKVRSPAIVWINNISSTTCIHGDVYCERFPDSKPRFLCAGSIRKTSCSSLTTVICNPSMRRYHFMKTAIGTMPQTFNCSSLDDTETKNQKLNSTTKVTNRSSGHLELGVTLLIIFMPSLFVLLVISVICNLRMKNQLSLLLRITTLRKQSDDENYNEIENLNTRIVTDHESNQTSIHRNHSEPRGRNPYATVQDAIQQYDVPDYSSLNNHDGQRRNDAEHVSPFNITNDNTSNYLMLLRSQMEDTNYSSTTPVDKKKKLALLNCVKDN